MVNESRVRRQASTQAERNSGIVEFAWLIGGGLAGGGLTALLVVGYLRDLPMPDSIATLLWYAVRVTGISAYLVLWLTTVAGICITGRVRSRWLPAGVVAAVHQLEDLALALVALHALLLLGDRYAGFTPSRLFVPFQASYRPFWTGLGILAFYLMVILVWSSALRPRLGYRAWRLIHYLAFLAFGMALAHGLISGTDSMAASMRLMYVVTGASVVGVTAWRVRHVPVSPPTDADRARASTW